MKKAPRRSRSLHSSVIRERGLVPISCPDCSGVLRLEEEGAHEYRLYVCQINHRYSTHSLIHAKETQVEHSCGRHCLLEADAFCLSGGAENNEAVVAKGMQINAAPYPRSEEAKPRDSSHDRSDSCLE